MLPAHADIAGIDSILIESPGAIRIIAKEDVSVVVEIADDRDVTLRPRSRLTMTGTAAAASRVLTVMRTSSDPAAASDST